MTSYQLFSYGVYYIDKMQYGSARGGWQLVKWTALCWIAHHVWICF